MSAKKDALSDKISALINPKPSFFDDENDDLTTIEQLDTQVNENEVGDDDLELGQFRKLNIELLDVEDKKYLGKKITRKGLNDVDAFGNDSSDAPVSSDDENVDDSVENSNELSESSGQEDTDENDSSGEGEENENDDDDDESSIEDEEEELNADENVKFENFGGNLSNDIEKGNAIRNQINFWDFLLECRIKFQKCLTASNQLPQGEKYHEFKTEGGEEYEKLVNDCESNLKKLLSSLIKLQEKTTTVNYESPTKLSRKHESDDSDQESDIKENKSKRLKLEDISTSLSENHEKFKCFRNETIQKWNEKTKISQIGNKNFSAFEQSTLKQIEQILMDKNRLIKRTHLKRSNYQILGTEDESTQAKQVKVDDNDEYNCEIFDDNDFYHQLLRELLERKSTDVTDPVQVSRQWIQLQKLRSKMKKKVDTKATKGRKIKYVVHQKLVNFMMPIVNHSWTEEAKNELFSSMFGKCKNKEN